MEEIKGPEVRWRGLEAETGKGDDQEDRKEKGCNEDYSKGRKRQRDEEEIQNVHINDDDDMMEQFPGVLDNMLFQYYHQTENQYILTKTLTQMQHLHRVNIMNWLTQIHWSARLSPIVLWLAARYIDGYIERCDSHDLGHSKCLGATSLFLALKLEENFHTRSYCRLVHIVGIGEKSFDPHDLIAMEQRLLGIFDGMINIPTVYHFLDHFLTLLHHVGVSVDIGIEQLSAYYAESTILSSSFSKLKASRVAAAVLYAAFLCRDQHTCDIANKEEISRRVNANSPVTVTTTANSPHPSPPDPSSGEISDQIVSALKWQAPLLIDGVKPSSLWLPHLLEITGFDAPSLKMVSQQIISRLVHPQDIHQKRSVSYQKYSSWRRFSVCHLRHPNFSETPLPAQGVIVSGKPPS